MAGDTGMTEPSRSADGDTVALPRLVLERYRLGPVIGRGGMATVHAGEDTQLRRPVAIKVLAPHLSADPQFRRRLLAEARAAARLPHPNIVQVFDVGVGETIGGGAPMDAAPGAEPASGAVTVGRDDGSVVLILELVPGESLDRRLAAGPLVESDAVEIAAQVAEALAFAHSRHVIHRDVKPQNILLAERAPSKPESLGRGSPGRRSPGRGSAGWGPEGPAGVWVKLADFGIARSIDATTSFTATGVVIGSAPYLAPELLHGEAAGPRCDIYALGVTLFQMLTARLPFEAPTAAASLTMRLAGDAPRVRSLRPELPAWLDELVARTLTRDPAQRVPDANTVARALRDGRDPSDQTTQVYAGPAAARPSDTGPRESARANPPGMSALHALAQAITRILPVIGQARGSSPALPRPGEATATRTLPTAGQPHSHLPKAARATPARLGRPASVAAAGALAIALLVWAWAGAAGRPVENPSAGRSTPGTASTAQVPTTAPQPTAAQPTAAAPTPAPSPTAVVIRPR